MARRIIVDGIKLEGEDAKRVIDEVLQNVDETGKPRRLVPLSLLLIVAVACGIAAGVTGYLLGVYAKGMASGWRIAICVAVSLVVSGVCSRTHWRFHRRKFREALRRHGFDLCPSCGYWLKGLGEDQSRCPECGAARE